MDNFEWAYGYRRLRAGAVDRATFVRTPKPSYHWFREVVRANALVPPPAG